MSCGTTQSLPQIQALSPVSSYGYESTHCFLLSQLSTPCTIPEASTFNVMNTLHRRQVRRSPTLSRSTVPLSPDDPYRSRSGFGGCLLAVGRFVFNLYPNQNV
ncbi:hypothetical protein FB451DRAFT_1418734 [Mycena latifolia]|nr:hypothetical protein FB451DRAFT_1418734 [Mycena latifolia]